MSSPLKEPADLAEQEYAALRATIAHRGTVRMVLAPLTVAVWAICALLQLAYSPVPITSFVPLMLLATGFEAVNALHVGVERIGRYLQVFYEEGAKEPTRAARWETTAMLSGSALPGGGID